MDLIIKHKSGKSNVVADALSRIPSNEGVEDSGAIAIVSVDGSVSDSAQLRQAQLADPEIGPMLMYLENSTVLPGEVNSARKVIVDSKHFCCIDGVLYRDTGSSRCCVVPEEFRQTLLEEAHAGRFAGHLAEKKVLDRIKRSAWWPGDVHHFCRSCLVCSSRKGIKKSCHPPLQPIPVGGPFHRVGGCIAVTPHCEW